MTTVDLSALSVARGGSATLSGYFAQPSGDGPWPAVVVVHEALGLDEATRRHVERIAGLGYLTLAPDLFSDGGARRCLVSSLRSVVSGEGRAYADLEAAREWLGRLDGCTGRFGIIGFCMGGAFALMTIGGGEYDVAAVNYGALPRDIDAALADACPVVASYGGRDFSLRGAAAKLDAALTRAGVVHDVREYPGAGHTFLNDIQIGPRPLRPLLRVLNVKPQPESSPDAWRRIEDFFTSQLT